MSTSTPASTDFLAVGDQLCPFKPSRGPSAVFPAFDPSPRQFTAHGMDVEFNHDVPMRDGILLRADVFRPAGSGLPEGGGLPVVLAITPYGKQSPFDVSSIPPSRDFNPGFDGVVQSKYAPFEASDPVFWTNEGFVYVIVDSRGSFASQGDKSNFVSKADGVDAYDVIEYFGSRPWSNGRVGMIGASALGAIQWYVVTAQHDGSSACVDGHAGKRPRSVPRIFPASWCRMGIRICTANSRSRAECRISTSWSCSTKSIAVMGTERAVRCWI